jgi:hypothetical protein
MKSVSLMRQRATYGENGAVSVYVKPWGCMSIVRHGAVHIIATHGAVYAYGKTWLCVSLW